MCTWGIDPGRGRGGGATAGAWRLLGLLVVWACGSEPAVGAGWPRGSEGASEASSEETRGEVGPPRVIDIGRDVPRLREGEAITITAVVVDPDDEIVSAQLYGPGEPALYSAFDWHGSDRWRTEVGWYDVHERRPLQFHLEEDLPFVARFVDAAGHVAEATIELRAICGGLRDNACHGECVDVQTSPRHCGGCDQGCATGFLEGLGPNGGCDGGRCLPHFGPCFSPTPAITCADRCAELGSVCAPSGCQGHTLMSYPEPGRCTDEVEGLASPIACEEPLVAQPGHVAAMRCCCA